MHIDGDGRGAFVAVGITNGVDESIQRIPRRYGIGIGVVLGIALGIDDQIAVLAMHLTVELAERRA
ncbi:hypothetical protein D3C81_1579100 [compost metagenome]